MEKLIAIQNALKAPKGQFNAFGKYKYRSCEDILEALKPLLHENKCYVLLTDEVIQVGNRIYIKATASLFDGEHEFSVSAFAREEEGKKGMDGSQVTGAASSYARKYALNGLFLIDDQKDADSQMPHETIENGDNKPKEPNISNNLLPWLNEKTPEYQNALDGLQKGYTISDIKKRYRLSKAIEQKLTDYKNEVNP